jgi:beta-lactam-binding protein with PASTA domain
MTKTPRPLLRGSSRRLLIAAAVIFFLCTGRESALLTLSAQGAGGAPTLRDTSSTDFAAGTGTGTYVSQTADGELILAPTAGSEFNGPALPVGWIVVPWANGATYLEERVLVVDGARVATCVTDSSSACLPETATSTPSAIFTAPHSIEFSANFSGDQFQHAGFAVTFDLATDAPPWAIFSTFTGGRLYARTDSGSDSRVDDLGTGLLGAFHRYRIDWKTDRVDYYVDGALVVSHPLTIAGSMRPVAGSDVDAFGGTLLVDWTRMSPYAASGTFVSRVFDAHAAADWRNIQWIADSPAGTSVAVSVRTGNTPAPDGSWSAFIPVAAPGPLNLVSQFIQYRAVMTSSDPNHTPSFKEISITTGHAPVAVADGATVPENGNHIFPASGPGSLTVNDTDADIGDALHVVSVGPPAHGAAVVNGNGSVTYTPAANYHGPDAFTYTVGDGALTASATVSIDVEAATVAPVSVPDVVGMTQAAATSALTAAGLTVGIVTTAPSATVVAGSVISESPAAGTLFAAGSSVHLVVSSGPAPVRVPNVVGLAQAAGTSVITSAGLTLGTVSIAPSATVTAGSISGITPSARTLVAAGSTVNLVVSSGPAPVNVPNVVGLAQAAASSAVAAAGLTSGAVTTASSATVPKGSIISQSPAAGTSVAAGSVVNLTVSAGPNIANLEHVADLDGDGRADLNVYRPSTGTWFNLRSSSNYTTFGTFQWGLPADIPVSSDYDGDGTADLGIFRPASGTWYIRQSSTNFTTSVAYQWGLPGDVPVPGDYDGDAKADLAIFRPANGTWYIRYSGTNFTTSAEYQWGLAGDISVSGDYDGDGISDLAVFRSPTGMWYIRLSTTAYTTSSSFQWGLSGDITVPGDYDGDRKTDLGIYRPSGGLWYIRYSSTNYTTSATYQWGLSQDVPVPSDFDGDGKTDVAVFRPSIGFWFLLMSNTNFTTSAAYQWGLPGDIPILNRH